MRVQWAESDRRIEAFDDAFAACVKQGNKHLRKLPVHGARGAMPTLARSATPLGAWLHGLLARTASSGMDRFAMAVLRSGVAYEAKTQPA